jgi:hypothetical protein
MSAVRVRVGEYWLTGAPGQPQSVATSAAMVGFTGRQQMETLMGAEWPAVRVLDMLQRGVTVPFGVVRGFATVTAKVGWLASVLSLTPPHAWQGDVFLRWEHEDGVGYSESVLPWAGVRLLAVEEAGPLTLRLQYELRGAELADHALFELPLLVSETGVPLVSETGVPLLGEDHILTLADL